MLPSSIDFFIAWRYLRAPRNDGVITLTSVFALVGIALGVATLIIVTSVMNGFREELFNRMLGFTADVSIFSPGRKLAERDKIITIAQEDAAVRLAAPLVEGQALLSARGSSSGVLLRGITNESISYKPKLFESLSAEQRDDFALGDSALIGEQLARIFALRVGDSISLLVPQGVTTAFGSLPNEATLRISGVFKTGVYEYDSGFVLLPLALAQNLLGYGDNVDSIELRLQNPQQALLVKKRLQSKLPEQSIVLTWQEKHSSLHEALIVERNVMFLLLTLIVLIAAFNIVSGQAMLVHDKQRGIAILRSLGMKPASVLRIFLIIGSAIGISGTLIGSLVGIAFAARIDSIERFIESIFGIQLFPFEVYSLPSLPSRIEPTQVFSIVVLALVISFCAALYPARRASLLAPITILRGT